MRPTAALRDERGLVGKIAFVWLLMLAVFAVGAVDTGSILVTRFRVENAADDAAFQAASEYKESRDGSKAYQAAVDAVDQDSPGGRIPHGGFSIDARTGEVTVKVVKKAWSLIAGRLSMTKHYVRTTASSTSKPPIL